MAIVQNPCRWLTAKRLRAHATILALCLWGMYAWNIATPGLRDRNANLKGTDLLHLYTLGVLASEHRGADLYDMNAQAALIAQRVPEAAGIRYLPIYPPQVSIFFAPFAQLSYGWALVCWSIFNVAIYGLCCYGLWWACPNLRDQPGTVAIVALALPAFFHLIAWGQTSALAFACFTLMFFLLREKQDYAAGLILGCLIFKPQLGLAAAIVFVAVGAWKTILGALFSVAAELLIGIFYYGLESFRQWVRMLTDVRGLLPLLEPKPYQTHSLRTFWSMLIPWPEVAFALYALSAIAILAITISIWKRGPSVPLSLRYSTLLLSTVLVAPHLTIYDLVILAPAFLLSADWLIGQPASTSNGRLGTLLYLVYMLPLFGPFARWTHLQPSVIAMAAALGMIFYITRRTDLVSLGPGQSA